MLMTPAELAVEVLAVGLRAGLMGLVLALGWSVAGTTGPVQWLEAGGKVKRGAAVALRALAAFALLWVVANMGGGDPERSWADL